MSTYVAIASLRGQRKQPGKPTTAETGFTFMWAIDVGASISISMRGDHIVNWFDYSAQTRGCQAHKVEPIIYSA